MTEKQKRILETALKLFATEGFASTSTSKVAKQAGVSEGLIFRHFGNKQGLLDAILEQSASAARAIMADVLMAGEPIEIIRKLIEMPFNIDESQYEMWRLTYALKWQMDGYNSEFADPAKLIIADAFDKLGYDDPQAETELIFMLMDGSATAFLLHPPPNKEAILNAIKSKYNIQ